MKTIAILLLMLPMCCFSQKIVKNEVDEFTKKNIKETSWEIVSRNMEVYVFMNVKKIDNEHFLGLKFMLSNRFKVLSIAQNFELMLMMENDSIITVKCIESVVSCKGCGAKGFSGSMAWGINPTYYIEADYIDVLKNMPLKKIRMYTTEGHISTEINEKWKFVLKELLELVP